MCPNFGTKLILHLEQMENLLFSRVPILKHIMVPLSIIYTTVDVGMGFGTGVTL